MMYYRHTWAILFTSLVNLVVICKGCDPSDQFVLRDKLCCRPKFNCQPGYEIRPCTRQYEEEKCEKCADGHVQPFWSSSFDTEDRSCFKPNDSECFGDYMPRRHRSVSFFPRFCRCNLPNCYFEEDGVCRVRPNGCPPNQTLSENGVCIACKEFEYKLHRGCSQCLVDEEKYRNQFKIMTTSKSKIMTTSKSKIMTTLKSHQSTLRTVTTQGAVFMKRRTFIEETNASENTSVATGEQRSRQSLNTESTNTDLDDITLTAVVSAIAVAVGIIGIIIIIVILCRRRNRTSQPLEVTDITEAKILLANSSNCTKVALPDTTESLATTESSDNIDTNSQSQGLPSIMLPIDSVPSLPTNNNIEKNNSVVHPSEAPDEFSELVISNSETCMQQYLKISKLQTVAAATARCTPTASVPPFSSVESTSNRTASIPSNACDYSVSSRRLPSENADVINEEMCAPSEITTPKETFSYKTEYKT